MQLFFRNAIVAAVALVIAASNIRFHWASDYLACLLAVVAAGLAGFWYEKRWDHLGERKLRDMYGQDWD